MNLIIKRLFLLLIIAVAFSSCSNNKLEIENEDLYIEFKNPVKEARPRVWWHWTNGNVTKVGIHKDLHWVNRLIGDVKPGVNQKIT